MPDNQHCIAHVVTCARSADDAAMCDQPEACHDLRNGRFEAIASEHTCAVNGIDRCRACQLRDLAPELAEVILAWDEHDRGPALRSIEYMQEGIAVKKALRETAEKLRALSRTADAEKPASTNPDACRTNHAASSAGIPAPNAEETR